MPNVRLLRKSRRSSGNRGSLIVVLALAMALISTAALLAAFVFLEIASDLSDVSRIEAQFGVRGAESFRPLLVYDRSGETVLYQHLHPKAQARKWMEAESLPDHAVQAILAAVDPAFWTAAQAQPQSRSIPERLVEVGLMPPGEASLKRDVRRALLAAELSQRYPKERILSWYLNSADFGNAAYGIDAAALTYFEKHAPRLTLSESVTLAALLTARNDGDLQARRREIVEFMETERFVTRAQAARAGRDAPPLEVEPPPSHFASYLVAQLIAEMGPDVLGRSGLRVISTLNNDLQQQAGCAVESHLRRLSGESIATVSATADGDPCVAAALLPTVRPRDAGNDHGIDGWSLLVLDPTAGEILAAYGGFDQSTDPGPMLSPFIYLTAFSRGRTPSTMVVDLGEDLGDGHGPVRMRTALANLFPGAASAIQSSLGTESLIKTFAQLGLDGFDDDSDLLELSSAYGVIASEGRQLGTTESGAPSIIRWVEDSGGNVLYRYAPAERAVVSPQLAYLMVDVLSDESARWEFLGRANSLEIGRPAGAVTGSDSNLTGNWAIGFTPQRVVAVHLTGSPLLGIDEGNGAAAIWNAVTRFASADLQVQSWQIPPGMSEMEVCDPSGLLPTQYCPEVVRELFIQGTEPTHYDNLYQPRRVNQETGKLATLFTPLKSVEERVFFIPPPEAEAWAEAIGLERPPEEYDTLPSEPVAAPGVQLSAPEPFAILGDEVIVRGDVYPEGFGYYRLQYGQGLNPARWIQIGEDETRAVVGGRLGSWNTAGLNGLYTLQLLVVLEDEQISTAVLPVTLDNRPPHIELVELVDGQIFRYSDALEIPLRASASDKVGVDRIEYFVDGRRVGSVTAAPFRVDWQLPGRTGEFEVYAVAYDIAGNRSETERIKIRIIP